MADIDAAGTAEGGATAVLSIDGQPAANLPPVGPHTDAHGNVPTHVQGRFCAVVDVTGCNLHQIEIALQSNAHGHDPHPFLTGAHVIRHPVYIVGEPAELDLATVRGLYANRFGYVTADAPPADGSHIDI